MFCLLAFDITWRTSADEFVYWDSNSHLCEERALGQRLLCPHSTNRHACLHALSPPLLNAKNEGPDLSRRPPFSVWALQLAVFPSSPSHLLRQRAGLVTACSKTADSLNRKSSPHPFLCGHHPYWKWDTQSSSACHPATVWLLGHHSTLTWNLCIYCQHPWKDSTRAWKSGKPSPQCLEAWLHLQTQVHTARKPSILQKCHRQFSMENIALMR